MNIAENKVDYIIFKFCVTFIFYSDPKFIFPTYKP